MHIGRIADATHLLGAPENWNATKGHCAALPVRMERSDFGATMTSAWFPTPDEIASIQAGAPVYLTIIGAVHPPVALSVGLNPDDVAVETRTDGTGDDAAERKGNNP